MLLKILLAIMISLSTSCTEAATCTVQDLYNALAGAQYGWQSQAVIRGKSDFKKSPVPTAQKEMGKEKYKVRVYNDDKYTPTYVYFRGENKWVNLSHATDLEQVGSVITVSFAATGDIYEVHLRSEQEATETLNIIMKGVDAALPPYFVTRVFEASARISEQTWEGGK